MNNSENFIANGNLSSVLKKLVVPSILGSIIAQINIMIDSFFLGKFLEGSFATQALAATAIALPIVLFIMAIGNLFSVGGSIYAAQKAGAGEREKAKQICFNSGAVGTIFLVILSVIALIFLKPLLVGLGANNDQIYDLTYRYSSLLIVTSPVILWSMMYAMFLRAEGEANLVMKSISVQILFNFILNYVFIVLFNLDTTGAALGTIISQFIQLIYYTVKAHKKNTFYRFGYWKVKFNGQLIKNILVLGLPATIAFLMTLFVSVVLQIQASAYNDPQLLAAVGIVVKLVVMAIMLIQAAGSGVQPVFAYSYGAKDKNRFIEAKKIYNRNAMKISVIVSLILLIFPNIVSTVFTNDNDLEQMINVGVRATGLMILAMPLSFSIQILFQSMGEGRTAIRIVLIRQLLVFLPLCLIFPILFGSKGILASLQISVLLGSILTIILYSNKLQHMINVRFKN